MAKKERTPIPTETAAEVLFRSDRTCCVCNERGKRVQIHHIDENPSNNEIVNLAVLCFDCHDLTMISGGIGRRLDANQVRMYNEDWKNRVLKRKDKADEIASLKSVTGSLSNDNAHPVYSRTNDDPQVLKTYLDRISQVHRNQLSIAQAKWDTGVTATMNQGNYDVIDFYREVLTELATFYPKDHFSHPSPNEYFSKLVSTKFTWYRLMLEPEGAGKGGTIISTMTGGYVMDDLKKMVFDMVAALTAHYGLYDSNALERWKKSWDG